MTATTKTTSALARTFPTVAEAEAAVAESPVCSHGFARCEKVAAASADEARRTLQSAGYVWAADRKRWERAGFWAEATAAWVYVYTGENAALAIGAGGYLPREDRP